MSALTKFSVTGSPRKRAALAVCAKAFPIGSEPSSSAAATAETPVLRRQVVREARGSVILIRSK